MGGGMARRGFVLATMRAVGAIRRRICVGSSNRAMMGGVMAGGPTAWPSVRLLGRDVDAHRRRRRAGKWRLAMMVVVRAASTTCRTRRVAERKLGFLVCLYSSPIRADTRYLGTMPPVPAGQQAPHAVLRRAARRAIARAASTMRRPGPRLARHRTPDVPALLQARHRFTAELFSHATLRAATATRSMTTRSACAPLGRIRAAAVS